MINITDKNCCTGCTACYSSCPANCIQMISDKEGFQYPEVNVSLCIECGLCEKICPSLNINTEIEESSIYYYQTKDSEVRRLSTSGGVFYDLAMSFLHNGDSVFAVLYDDNMNVIHQKANSCDDIANMRMSKYVQSIMGDTIRAIKEELVQGKRVLFIGTPCQVEGVYESLSLTGSAFKDNLYLVDLACYGVPSPKVYRKWIDYIKVKYKSDVSNIFFRDKKYGYAGVNIKVVLSNGRILEDCADAKLFTKTMFSGIGLRPSCYNCKFRNQKKSADLTLSDGWDIDKNLPEFDDDKGTTKILCHTLKGNKLLNSLESGNLKFSGLTTAKPYGVNKDKHNRREMFFEDLDKLQYDALMNKYLPTTFKNHLANICKPLITHIPCSTTVFRTIKKLRRRRR